MPLNKVSVSRTPQAGVRITLLRGKTCTEQSPCAADASYTNISTASKVKPVYIYNTPRGAEHPGGGSLVAFASGIICPPVTPGQLEVVPAIPFLLNRKQKDPKGNSPSNGLCHFKVQLYSSFQANAHTASKKPSWIPHRTRSTLCASSLRLRYAAQ